MILGSTFELPYQRATMTLDESVRLATGVNHLYRLTGDFERLHAAAQALYPEHMQAADIVIPLVDATADHPSLRLRDFLERQDGRPYISVPTQDDYVWRSVAEEGTALIDQYGVPAARRRLIREFDCVCARFPQADSGIFADLLFEFFLRRLPMLQARN